MSFFVYAIELDEPWKVYIGSSAFSPEERFRRHKQGGMATSRHVKWQGKKLRPELYAGLNPFSTRREAKTAEQALASRLRTRGFQVFGSACAHPREDGCFGI